MKKIISFVLVIVLLTGCALMASNPKDVVADFLNKYKENDESVVKELDAYLKTEDLDDETLKDYKEIYLRQYSNLDYKIKDEKIDGDNATVNVQIKVFDYYKTNTLSGDYFTANKADFVDDDGDVDLTKYIKYKIKKLVDTTDTVEYNMDFKLKKNSNDKWEVEPLTNDMLEKLHGTYEY